jgi:hypothetical protein
MQYEEARLTRINNNKNLKFVEGKESESEEVISSSDDEVLEILLMIAILLIYLG